MEPKKIGKIGGIAILLAIIFLIIACIRLQMELNRLRNERDELSKQVDNARIEADRLTEAKEKIENDPEGFLEEKAYEQGYRDANDKVYINDMPNS